MDVNKNICVLQRYQFVCMKERHVRCTRLGFKIQDDLINLDKENEKGG